jgi:hypothetical protein
MNRATSGLELPIIGRLIGFQGNAVSNRKQTAVGQVWMRALD